MAKQEISLLHMDKNAYNLVIEKYLSKIIDNNPVNQNLSNKECSYEDLSQIEIEVLKIAKEILKLKRYSPKFEMNSDCQVRKYPILEKLYAKCIAKLRYSHGYTNEEIFHAIQNLEDKNWIISNQRRTKEEILNNKNYRAIIYFIKNNPGIHACDNKIETELNLTRTPFLKYIITLENFGLIRSTKFGKRLHFFSIDFPEIFEKLSILLSNPLICKILGEILKNSLISIKQISRNLQMFPNAIQYHLKKLQEAKLISLKMEGLKKQKLIVNLLILEKYMQFSKNNDVFELLNSNLN